MSARPIKSPCRQVCRLGTDGLCDGCGRALGEIAAWSSLSDAERDRILGRVAGWIPREPRAGPDR